MQCTDMQISKGLANDSEKIMLHYNRGNNTHINFT